MLRVPAIFWTTLLGVPLLMALVTVLGRPVASLLPHRLRAPARFYLAPAFGLAISVLVSVPLVRWTSVGNSILVSLILWGGAIVCLLRERAPSEALRHALAFAFFGVICGSAVLVTLFSNGAFVAQNEAFAYIAQSDWFQSNHTGAASRPDFASIAGTASSRLVDEAAAGGTRLMALIQATLVLSWAFETYSIVAVAVTAVGCLAIGFALRIPLSRVERLQRLAVLTLPAFSLGGITGGMYFGRLSQSVGLALGSAAMFLVGSQLATLPSKSRSRELILSALPTCALVSASAYAIPEFAPVMLAAICGTASLVIYRGKWTSSLAIFVAALIVTAGILLNVEVVRAYTSIWYWQDRVADDSSRWPMSCVVAHILGLQGDVDSVHCSIPGATGARNGAIIAIAVLVLALALAVPDVWNRKRASRQFLVSMSPALIALLVIAISFAYFRYLASSPASEVVGGNQARYKLTDWAHPFLAPLLLGAILTAVWRVTQSPRMLLLALTALAAAGNVHWARGRLEQILVAYPEIDDVASFYRDFRRKIFGTCGNDRPVYLLGSVTREQTHRFMAHYIADRKGVHVVSGESAADPDKVQLPLGVCIVAATGERLSRADDAIGFIDIAVHDGSKTIPITSFVGTFDAEFDGKNEWRWVERKAVLAPSVVGPSDLRRLHIHFEYRSTTPQTLTLNVVARGREVIPVRFHSKGFDLQIFERVVEVAPSELVEISIETDGTASALGPADPRVAAWMLRNVRLRGV